MLEHISKPANRLLNKIASKRIGETLEQLENEQCSDRVKNLVKQRMWLLKDEAEMVLEARSCDDKENT